MSKRRAERAVTRQSFYHLDRDEILRLRATMREVAKALLLDADSCTLPFGYNAELRAHAAKLLEGIEKEDAGT